MMISKLESSSAGLIIRQKEPLNLETPFDQLDSFLTPTGLFYIRSHFPAPTLDPTSYRLHIDGAVRNPFSLSFRELRDMKSETHVAVLECAGNCRVFLVPQARGAQWELGTVGNAEWTGVPRLCLSGLDYKKRFAKSCLKELTGERLQKSQYLRSRSRMPVVCH